MTRVLVVDDHQIMREGLRALLAKDNSISIVGEACEGREAVELAVQLKPDVVVMDIAMKNLNGIDATRQICAEVPGTQVVALSMYLDPRFASQMFQAGARGYVAKENALSELLQAIHAVQNQQRFLSPAIDSSLVVETIEAKPRVKGERRTRRLSPREREVLQLLAEGLSNAEVGERLDISAKTVETHRRRITDKLQIFNIAELTKYAISEGITTVSF